MKYCNCFFLIVFFSSMSLFAQQNYRQHTVAKGETISEIAKKYSLKPSAIYGLNPQAVKGIKVKSVLLIPNNLNKKTTDPSPVIASENPEKNHEVLPKETLYGIAKQHNITLKDLYKMNPNLEKEGLKIGQIIKLPQDVLEDTEIVKNTDVEFKNKNINVPQENAPKEEVVVPQKIEQKKEVPAEGMEYEVLPKESFYSIAKKHSIKLADLQNANSVLENTTLKPGQKIIVPINAALNNNPVVEKKEAVVLSTNSADDNQIGAQITHKVLSKESLYTIAKQHGITLAELKKANPLLGTKALRIGQRINVPVNTNSNLVAENVIVKDQKEIGTTPLLTIEGNKPKFEMAHEVLAKETKYGIAKQYGLTVVELEKQNPSIAKKLLVGSVLKISTSKEMETKISEEELVLGKEESVKKDAFYANNKPNDVEFVDKLISTASENMGTRYRPGGTTKAGFDCSGLMCYAFSNYDIKLPRSSIEMASYGSKVDAQSAQKGDLIFFKTGGKRRINHVGMVVEVLDGEIKFIHSSTSSGVMISSTKEPYYERNFAQVNRVLHTQL